MGAAVWDSGSFSTPVTAGLRICQYCAAQFTDPAKLQDHLDHHPLGYGAPAPIERTAYCGLCQFRFGASDDVDEHMQLHVAVKPDGTPVIVPGPQAQVSDLQRMLEELRR